DVMLFLIPARTQLNADAQDPTALSRGCPGRTSWTGRPWSTALSEWPVENPVAAPAALALRPASAPLRLIARGRALSSPPAVRFPFSVPAACSSSLQVELPYCP